MFFISALRRLRVITQISYVSPFFLLTGRSKEEQEKCKVEEQALIGSLYSLWGSSGGGGDSKAAGRGENGVVERGFRGSWLSGSANQNAAPKDEDDAGKDGEVEIVEEEEKEESRAEKRKSVSVNNSSDQKVSKGKKEQKGENEKQLEVIDVDDDEEEEMHDSNEGSDRGSPGY